MSDDLPEARPRANVSYIGPSDHFTPTQALDDARQFADQIRDVLILGLDQEGEIFMRSSHMSREWALWLMLEMQDYIREVGRYTPD